MTRTNNPSITTRPASLVLVGEITHTLRAQGNAIATGIEVNGNSDSPVVSGQWMEVPQAQIGLLDYNSFIDLAGKFKDGVTDKDPWNILGATSLDAIFYPYNNFTSSGRAGPYLPYWTAPASTAGSINSTTLNPFNPFNQLSGINPRGNPIGNDPWYSGGHNIAMALNYNPLDSGINGSGGYVGASGTYPFGSGSPVDLYFEKDHWARSTVEVSGIRGVGLKAPMVLTGWGYDIDGNPVPSNPADSTKFHPQASWNPSTWKSGPVDLRWDNDRGVWTGGNTTKLYLVKLTNLYTPPSFSFEVERSNSRNQYTRNAPPNVRAFSSTGNIYDPEYLAYNNNSSNIGYYEQLDYNSLEFPFYEAFIIRETQNNPTPANDYYNIWTNDCQDCGHVTIPCSGAGHGTSSSSKKILVENPLRQSFDVGDLAFTVYTGRTKKVNTGSFTGGNGVGASGKIVVDASGRASFSVLSAGSGYTTGGFAIQSTGCNICTNISLTFTGNALSSGTLTPSSGFPPSQECIVNIYPNNATVETESLPIHWVLQAEFKSQQVVTHVECDNGVLQTCTLKIQTQGYKTCEWCGEDTALINN
jgi:hypothetical protein